MFAAIATAASAFVLIGFSMMVLGVMGAVFGAAASLSHAWQSAR
jgi:hypothetical protein